MDKELPWLADNAQLELKYKKGKTPLSHRKYGKMTTTHVIVRKRVSGTCIYWHSCRVRWL
ncbi:TPA: hypothetical protein ACP4VC_004421 [Escherichia coli]